MFRMLTRSARPCCWIVTCGLVGIAGCGGGGDQTPAPAAAAKTETAKTEPAKEGTPTVKGLGGKAKERQGEMDSQAAGGAAPGAAAQPSNPQAEARKAMMQAQGGPSGGRPSETDGPPATGPGAASVGAPGAAGPAGGYVPGYAQGGSQGGSQGGPGGGGAPPGVAFGAAPGPGGQAAGMMPPGGYGAPGAGMPGSFGGGASGPVLLAETAFLEDGEALTGRVDGQPGGQGPAGEGGPGGFGDDKAKNDFSDPTKAVESFLSAAKARDGERIGQAISRRAPGEAKGAGLKRVMTNAVEKKLTDEEIANISETFADYTVININPGRTSGSVNVTVGRERKGQGKADRTTYERRIMRVHRDGNTGFKILDFGNRIVND